MCEVERVGKGDVGSILCRITLGIPILSLRLSRNP